MIAADRRIRRSARRQDAWPGVEGPLGATWDGEGTNFAVSSATAEAVDVVLFDEDGVATATDALLERTDLVWHGSVHQVGPVQRAGFRLP